YHAFRHTYLHFITQLVTVGIPPLQQHPKIGGMAAELGHETLAATLFGAAGITGRTLNGFHPETVRFNGYNTTFFVDHGTTSLDVQGRIMQESVYDFDGVWLRRKDGREIPTQVKQMLQAPGLGCTLPSPPRQQPPARPLLPASR